GGVVEAADAEVPFGGGQSGGAGSPSGGFRPAPAVWLPGSATGVQRAGVPSRYREGGRIADEPVFGRGALDGEPGRCDVRRRIHRTTRRRLRDGPQVHHHRWRLATGPDVEVDARSVAVSTERQ